MTKNSARPDLARAATRLAEIEIEIARILHVFPFLAAGVRRRRQRTGTRDVPEGIGAVLSRRGARRRRPTDTAGRGAQGGTMLDRPGPLASDQHDSDVHTQRSNTAVSGEQRPCDLGADPIRRVRLGNRRHDVVTDEAL